MDNISRRNFLKAAGGAAVGAVAGSAASPVAAADAASPYAFFNPQEAAFIEVAVARLIPGDAGDPGALEAGVARYIDRQLAGAWGAGERLYRSGPWQAGEASQGYQLPFTPAELFRNALRALVDDVRKTSPGGLRSLSAEQQDAYLKSLESGSQDLGGVPAKQFFQSLLEMTIEGFFADPVYGGNRDMVGWKMIGFPGAYANYYDLVDRHGIAFIRPPLSIADGSADMGHLHSAPAESGGKGG